MRLIAVIFSIIALQIQTLSAQELNFSQFFNTKQYFNPVDAASFDGIDAYIVQRSQWQGLSDPFTSTLFCTAIGILRDGDPNQHIGGIGLEIDHFGSGPGNLDHLAASINGAYNLYFESSKVHEVIFGLKLGYQQRSIGFNDLTWGTQYVPGVGLDATLDPNENDFNESVGSVAVGAGIGYYYNHSTITDPGPFSFHIKAAVLNINEPVYSFSSANEKSNREFTSEFGFSYLVSDKIQIGSDVLYLQQGDNSTLNPGAYMSLIVSNDQEKVIAPTWFKYGLWYRVDNAYIGYVGLGNGRYRVNFSYDMGVSSLSENASGFNAFEIALGIRFRKKKHIDANPYNNNHNPRI